MGLEEKDPKNVPFKWVRFIIRNKSWCLLGRERRTVTKKKRIKRIKKPYLQSERQRQEVCYGSKGLEE